jgi:hypothetical protein
MYDASIGRWFVVDPLANHGLQIDKSPYAYGWNNPIKYNDPSGLCPNGCSENEQSGEPYRDGAIVENKYGKSKYKDGEWIVISNTPDGSGSNTSTEGGSGSGSSTSESSGNGFLGSSGWGDMSPMYSDNPVIQRMRENSASIRRNVMPFVRHMTRSSIDAVGYTGASITAIGTIATPFVPPVGAGLIGVGGAVSTVAGGVSTLMYAAEGDYISAAIEGSLTVTGAASGRYLKNMASPARGLINSTSDLPILQGLKNTSLDIVNLIIVPKVK